MWLYIVLFCYFINKKDIEFYESNIYNLNRRICLCVVKLLFYIELYKAEELLNDKIKQTSITLIPSAV